MRLDTNYRSKERPLLSRRNQRFGANAIRVPKITKTKTSNHLTRPTSLEMLKYPHITHDPAGGLLRVIDAWLRQPTWPKCTDCHQECLGPCDGWANLSPSTLVTTGRNHAAPL